MGSRTLVLNASYEPMHIVPWERAIQLLFQGKVEVLEESDRQVRTVRLTINVPAVLRLLKFIPLKAKRHVVRFSRANVFLRDNHQCQYCGIKQGKSHLTLDHVVPVVRKGKKSWENIVTCCKSCNQKKGGRTPREAGLKLIRTPKEPAWLPRTSFQLGINIVPNGWKPYLELYWSRKEKKSKT